MTDFAMNENKMVVAFFFGMADLTGGPRVGREVARSFVKRGHHVLAIVGGRPKNESSVVDLLRADGVEIIEEEGFEKLLSFALVRRCEQILRIRKVELIVSVIQIDVKIAAMVAGSLGLPLVVMGQSLTTFYGPKPLRQAKAWAFRHLVKRRASLVVAVSSVVKNHFVNELRVPSDRVEIIQNSIDVKRFDNAVVEGFGEGVNLLSVGRLDTQKGHDILLEALGRLPANILENCTLSLVGGETISSPSSAAFADKLRRQAECQPLNGRVKFLGWRDDVPVLLSKCDIYVHPARWEGFPLAVLESMAAAAPVIFTDCFGELEGFEQGVNGFRVPPGDVGALRNALEAVIAMPRKTRREMGRRARDLVVNHYDVEVLGKRFVARCEALLANVPAG